MTLQDIKTEDLDSIKELVSKKALVDLINSRILDIKKNEWELPVTDSKEQYRHARSQGMVDAWESLLQLPKSIDEEKELRAKEEEIEKRKQELARAGKR